MGQTDQSKVDEFLFGHGLRVEDYFIEHTPVSEVIGYKDAEGREFDLNMDDAGLAAAAKRRLKELGVRIVKLG